ncbi:hypothetical protein VTN00DRAFT_5315 [Thermoascus crustaceus]|uniref:uncharacterized protein n=1 Tax=Thermoascus crustaceus TaxID=5088 RepID=UPI0037432438
MSSTGFCSLSAELIEHIASFLEPRDLFSFRLVCRWFNSATFNYFGRTRFMTFKTNLSHESLRELQAIAENEQFRPHIRTLFIHGVDELGQGFSLTLDIFDWSMELLIRAPRLQKPALNTDHVTPGDELLVRLSSMQPLPKLRELRFCKVHSTEGTILRLLLQLRESLRAVSLGFCNIESGGTWRAVLHALRHECPSVEGIDLFRLVESPRKDRYVAFPALLESAIVPGLGGQKFILTTRHSRGQLRVWGVDYSGPRMDTALELLERSSVNF